MASHFPVDAAGIISAAAEKQESSWGGDVRVSPEGVAYMTQFTKELLADAANRGALEGISSAALAHQIDVLTREFLRELRSYAGDAGTLEFSSDNASELPYELIEGNLPAFVAGRCHCWPQ